MQTLKSKAPANMSYAEKMIYEALEDYEEMTQRVQRRIKLIGR